MATSMPGISASGNMTPQSMAIAVSPCSRTSRLSPISPSPPSGITRSGAPAPLPPLIERVRAFGEAARDGRGGRGGPATVELGLHEGTHALDELVPVHARNRDGGA